jgi:hypothetical protein
LAPFVTKKKRDIKEALKAKITKTDKSFKSPWSESFSRASSEFR